MTLSLDTAYRSFGGEVEASSTPTICRLPDSRRHQLSAIAPGIAPRFTVYAPFVIAFLCRFQTICCTKSPLTTDLRFQPVNLFDCATVESFCGLQGRKGFVR